MEPIEASTPTADSAPVVQQVDPAKARRTIWIVLLILGGMQAWGGRHTSSPDGMSYVDLSDAIVTGHLGELLNAYWSPLYPTLLGLLRLVFRPGPYWEFALQHFLNVLLFAGSIAGFEYFRAGLADMAADWGREDLTTIPGTLIAYGVFGVFSLMMTPLTLPTPDLLVTTASFVTFGALIRLTRDPDAVGSASVLGIALGLGGLAKSFYVPWAVVCMVVFWWALRSRPNKRSLFIAGSIWLVIIVPWCLALSARVGHPTFGDTGRLTYIWYVNQRESPSNKMMPHAAATPTTDSILKGVAITPNAPGTNPVWYDPARWYTDLKPEWHAQQQLEVFSYLVSQYVGSLAPIIFLLWFAFSIARRDDQAIWWDRTWMVVVPSLAAIGAYSLVVITTRYVVPFYVAIILTTWLGLRWPSRLAPSRVAVGVAVPFLIMMSAKDASGVISWENAAVGCVLFAWAGRRWGPEGMVVGGIVGAVIVKILQPASLRSFLIIGACLIILAYWIASRRAIANKEAFRFSRIMRRGLVVTSALTVLLVAVLKYLSSVQPPFTGLSDPNANWVVVQSLRAAGIKEGDRIAIIGSPFEAYWARTGRLHIVAVVPPIRVTGEGVTNSMIEYMKLTPDNRDRLHREFARAGAKVVIFQQSPPPVPGDTTWKPVEYVGWVKRLAPR